MYIYPSRFFLHVNRFFYTGFLCFLDYYYFFFFFFLTHEFILPVLLWRLPFSRNITCHGQSLSSVCTDRSYNGGIVAIGCMRCALLIVSSVFGPRDYVQSSWQTELRRTFYVRISAHLCWPWPGVTWKWAPGVGDFLFSSGSPATTLCTC